MKYDNGDIVLVWLNGQSKVGVIIDSSSFDLLHVYRVIVAGEPNKVWWIDGEEVRKKL